MSAGTRRSGSSKFGLFKRASPEGGHRSQHGERVPPAWEATSPRPLAWEAPTLQSPQPPQPPQPSPFPRPSRDSTERYAGRHAGPRRKTARQRAGRVVPAVTVAAAVAAGAVAYGVSGGHSQAAQLADIAQPSGVNSPARVGAGAAESAASAMIKATRKASGSVGRASAKPQPSRSVTVTAAPKSSATRAATASTAATPTATATASSSATPAATTLSCNLSYGLLPANVSAIVTFLIAHGYTDNAAAGIAGNMYQESKGNPESEGMGGGGLIGFTPLPSGYVTGDPAADLQTQLDAVLTYNQQWASYLPALDDAATPADAAYIYVTDFERAGIPAASTREASANEVAEACGI